MNRFVFRLIFLLLFPPFQQIFKLKILMNLMNEYGIGANAREFALFFGLSLNAKNDFQIQNV